MTRPAAATRARSRYSEHLETTVTMTLADLERARAAELPPGTIISVLLEQHARIRDLFTQTMDSPGRERRASFDELRQLLAVHEAGEQIVVRRVTRRMARGKVADARNDEERQAAAALAELEKLDVQGEEFARALAALERDVSRHAELEESEEFPYLIGAVDHGRQLRMGSRLLKVQRAMAAQPHQGAAGTAFAQVALGPFAVLLERAREAFSNMRDDS